MSALGPFLRRSGSYLMFWCEGCGNGHLIDVENRGWRFDGNVEAPTITPSVLVFDLEDKEAGTPQRTICHLFVTAGQVQYLGDCDHPLKGQTRPLLPIPKDYGGLED